METATLNKVVEVTTTTTELKRALRIISKVIKVGWTIPSCDNVMLHVEYGVLTVTGGDLSVRVSRKIFIRNDFMRGTFLVPFTPLYKLLTVIPAGEIVLSKSSESSFIHIKADNSSFSIKSFIDFEDYPITPKVKLERAFKADGKEVEEGLIITQRSVSKDDLRPMLCGILFDTSGSRLTIVSTDGHVLSAYETNLDILDPLESFVVPSDVATVLLSVPHLVKYDALVYVSRSHVKFEIGETEVFCRLVNDGDSLYPDWKSIIDNNPQYSIHLNVKSLVNKIEISQAFSNKLTGNRIEFNFRGRSVDMISENLDEEYSSKQSLPLEGDEVEAINDFRIGFNGSFMRKQFKPFSGLMRAEFWHSNKHVLFYPQTKNARSFKILIMPIAINSHY